MTAALALLMASGSALFAPPVTGRHADRLAAAHTDGAAGSPLADDHDVRTAYGGPRAQSQTHVGDSPFDPPASTDTVFVVDQGPGLDTGCSYRSDGPLIFNIPVKRVLDSMHRAALLSGGLISEYLHLQMPAYDVDYDASSIPERDRVSFNGHVVPGEYLTGANNVWKMNDFQIPIEWVMFATEGSGTLGLNTIQIDIDTANGPGVENWCTAIDWASLTIEHMPRPVLLAHGMGGSHADWDDVWVPRLDGAGIYVDGSLDLGFADYISNDADKIGVEVDKLRQRYGVDKVNLVGYSQGGLDVREYAEKHDTVDTVIQLGAPNAGTPLADAMQAGAVQLAGLPATALVNAFATPAGAEVTVMAMTFLYNPFHGHNNSVHYYALAGDYVVTCNVLTGGQECAKEWATSRFMGPGANDTIVPMWSVDAMSWMNHVKFPASGSPNDPDALHGGLIHSQAIFRILLPYLAPSASTGAAAETAAAAAAPAETIAAEVAMGSNPISVTHTAVGALHAGDVQTRSLVIDRSGATSISLFYGGGDLRLVLISPSGRRIDPSVADTDPDIDYAAGDITGGLIATYALNHPEVGTWTTEITAVSIADPAEAQGYAVTAYSDVPGSVSLAPSVTPGSVHVGDALVVQGTLTESSAPVLGALVHATVAEPDGTLVDFALHDDGLNGDATAGDGIYSGHTAATTQPGDLTVVVTASGTAGSGAAFSREATALATVSASRSTLAGFGDRGVDTNNDGLYDQLAVDVTVNADVAGDYRIVGTLRDSAGNTHEASTDAHLAVGTSTVSLLFDGQEFFQDRVDGPYTLADVELAEQGAISFLPVTSQTNAYRTGGYSYLDFQHAALWLTGHGSATGVDLDGNGLYDRLDVSIEVQVDTPGSYQWSAQLHDPSGAEIGFTSGSGALVAGTNSLDLHFDGRAIGSHGVDGPYDVTDLLLFGAGANLAASQAFETSAFTASQFEGFAAPIGQLSPAPFDFGNVLVGSSSSHTFTLTNSGSADLHVPASGAVAVSGTGFSIIADACSAARLAPTTTCTVSVSFAPTTLGSASGALSIASDATNSPNTADLSGNGTGSPALTIAPPSKPFGSVLVGQTSATQTFTVSSTGTADLHVSTAVLGGTDPGQFTIGSNTCTGAALAPGSTCQVSISFAPTTTGSKNATLVVTSDAASSPDSAALSGTGVVPTGSLSPAPFDFGNVLVGSSSSHTFTLTNSGSADLHVPASGAVAVSGTGFSIIADACSAARLAPTTTCTVSVSFAPTTLGSASGALSIASDATNSPNTADLSGNGTDSPIITRAPQLGLVIPSVLGTGSTRISWDGTDGTGSGIASYHLQRKVDSAAWTDVATTSHKSWSVSLKIGHRYTFRVCATDNGGNTGSWGTGPSITPRIYEDTNTKIHYAGGTWHRQTISGPSGGTTHYTSKRGARARMTFRGRAVVLVTALGSKRGSVAVYIDGVFKKSLNLHASSTQWKAIRFGTLWKASGTHTIEIKVTSSGQRVDLDAYVFYQ